MTNRVADITLCKTARIAGVLYLFIIIFAILAGVIRANLIMWEDAAATARNIMDSEWLFRISFMSDLIQITSYFLFGLTLYMLFKPINKTIALSMLVLNFFGAPIMAINMLNQFAALYLLSGADYLKVFRVDQLQALAMFFLNMHSYGYQIAFISYGGYFLPFGYLIYKSGYFPKFFGVMYNVAAIGFIDFFVQFLLPKYADISPIALVPGGIAEISFCLWLLIKGVKVEQLEKRVFESA
jgi:hypothetical protein